METTNESYECKLQPDTKIDELTFEELFNSSSNVTINICFSACSSYFIKSIQDTALLDLYQSAITRIAKATADHISSVDDEFQKCYFQYGKILFSFTYHFVKEKDILFMKITGCAIDRLVTE